MRWVNDPYVQGGPLHKLLSESSPEKKGLFPGLDIRTHPDMPKDWFLLGGWQGSRRKVYLANFVQGMLIDLDSGEDFSQRDLGLGKKAEEASRLLRRFGEREDLVARYDNGDREIEFLLEILKAVQRYGLSEDG